ncbi:hypothetical protein ED352_04825 [Muribaculaceae bacterium Isolate-002 (NCI)]|nr:hypothetical protein ED352_04825 [Muribaculaceae bacterium Isolate-002 (NCI)]
MEQTAINRPEAKTMLGKSFKIAAIGAAICLISSIFDIIMSVKETDSLTTLSEVSMIIGLILWGIGLIGAGNTLCRMGHLETGVRSAGGALILWAIISIVSMFVIKEDTDPVSAKFLIWEGLWLIGPAIFYFSLKQEKNKEDKFFDTAAMGIGTAAVCEILLVAAILLAMSAMEGHGVSMKSRGEYIEVSYSKGFAVGKWIAENYKFVTIVLSSVSTLGYLMAFGSMCSHNDFINDLKEEKAEEEVKELINEVVSDYKSKKAAETANAKED